MRLKTVGVLTAILAGAVLLVAQTTDQPPKPGPEVQKLAYFIGTWQAEAEMKASKFGPGGKVTNTSRNEWVLDRFFYLTHHEEHNPTGTYHVMSITGYDPRKKVYTTYSFMAGGGIERSEGSVEGDTWTWHTDYEGEGKTVKTRTVIKPTSATSYDFKWEVAPNGNDWTTVQEGSAKKVK